MSTKRAVFFCVGLIATTVFAGEKEEQLSEIRRQIDNVSQQVTLTQSAYSNVELELAEADRQIGEISKHMRVLTASVQKYQLESRQIREKKTYEQQRLSQQRQQLAAQIHSAYVMGRQDRIKILLNQEDPDVLERVMVYYDYLARARARQMASIGQSISTINSLQQSLQIAQEKANVALAKRSVEQENLLLKKNQRQAVLSELKQQWKDSDSQLKDLKSSEEDLLSIIRQLSEDVVLPKAMEQAFPNMQGRLPWPTKGRLAISFGATKVGGLRWDGVLITASEGRDVSAVHRGRVAYSDWLRGYGLLLIIDHGNEYMTLYGHNESLLKDPGEWVEAGEIIATVGSSGGNTRSGVYFGIRKKGKPRNPKKWCQKPRGNKVG